MSGRRTRSAAAAAADFRKAANKRYSERMQRLNKDQERQKAAEKKEESKRKKPQAKATKSKKSDNDKEKKGDHVISPDEANDDQNDMKAPPTNKRTKKQEPQSKKKAKVDDKEGSTNEDESDHDIKHDDPSIHDTREMSKLWKKHYALYDRFMDEFDYLKQKMKEVNDGDEDVTIITMKNALEAAKLAQYNYIQSQDNILDSDDLRDDDPRILSMRKENSNVTAQMRLTENAILEAVSQVENDAAKNDKVHSDDQTDKEVKTSADAMSSSMLPIQLCRPYYDARKDGIVFDGSSAKAYSTFLNGWQSVVAEYAKFGRPKIDLFRQLKRCLVGDAKRLVMEIPESEAAVDEAFDIMDRLYLRPFKAVLDAYKEMTCMTMKDDVSGSQNDYMQIYRKFVTVQKVRNLYKIDEKTSNALWMISNTMRMFTPKMENDFHRWMKKNYSNEHAELKYDVSEACMQSFLEYGIEIGHGHSSNDFTKKQDKQFQFKDKFVQRLDKKPYYKPSFNKPVISSTFNTHVMHYCAICKGKHGTHNCPNINDMTPQSLFRVVRQNRLCWGCYQHVSGYHPCRIRCTKCNGRHSNKLHFSVVNYHNERNGGAPYNRKSGYGMQKQQTGYLPRRQFRNDHFRYKKRTPHALEEIRKKLPPNDGKEKQAE